MRTKDFGGEKAVNLLAAVNSVMLELFNGDEEQFRVKLVCATADGAKVNQGRYNGKYVLVLVKFHQQVLPYPCFYQLLYQIIVLYFTWTFYDLHLHISIN